MLDNIQDYESDSDPHTQSDTTFTLVKSPKRRRSQRDTPSSSFPYSTTMYSENNFLNLASEHGLSQGLTFEFQHAHQRCCLQNQEHQLPLLYRVANTVKPHTTPDKLRARFSSIIDK
jgi:hypothetical protein